MTDTSQRSQNSLFGVMEAFTKLSFAWRAKPACRASYTGTRVLLLVLNTVLNTLLMSLYLLVAYGSA